MTDIELLEAAARAAGMSVEWVDGCGLIEVNHDENATRGAWWNPLEDDAQAFQLAVKLHLTIQRPWMDDERTELREVRVWSSAPDYVYESLVGADELAATRRAIVRAAAAMEQS